MDLKACGLPGGLQPCHLEAGHVTAEGFVDRGEEPHLVGADHADPLCLELCGLFESGKKPQIFVRQVMPSVFD